VCKQACIFPTLKNTRNSCGHKHSCAPAYVHDVLVVLRWWKAARHGLWALDMDL
jgi:hypothetical protein